jgi:hypothetical protein
MGFVKLSQSVGKKTGIEEGSFRLLQPTHLLNLGNDQCLTLELLDVSLFGLSGRSSASQPSVYYLFLWILRRSRIFPLKQLALRGLYVPGIALRDLEAAHRRLQLR